VTHRDSDRDRKVTVSEVFRIGEYRALYAATQLSWVGDYMAKAAVMALVYAQTGSTALAAAAFATTYAPWLLGGPFLAALAERLRYRQVMIVCDLSRAGLIALVAIPDMPLPAMLLLVFGVAMLAPPGQAARSATLPLVLTGERVVLGLAVNQASGQAFQVVGYMTGALVAAANPQVALLINATTFTASAIILRLGVRNRAPAMRQAQRSNLLQETADGFRVVFGTPALRVIAVIVFASMLWVIVPEGLAIGWADHLADGADARRGFYQGLIMVANPVGVVLGGLLIARMLRPSVRRRLIPIFAVLAPLSLAPALADPGIATVVAITTASGVFMAGMTPTLNGLFVQILRHGFRARAFGVMNSGIQVIQGLAILCAGVLTGVLPLHQVVGLWALAGVAVMAVLAARWPKPQFFDDAVTEAEIENYAVQAEEEESPPPVVPQQATLRRGGTGSASSTAATSGALAGQDGQDSAAGHQPAGGPSSGSGR
jgi:hypothetical protein